MCQDIDHLLAIFDSASSFDRMSKHGLLTGVMNEWAEHELAACTRLLAESDLRGLALLLGHRVGVLHLRDGPSGECTRHFLYVLLGIASIDSHRMEFHQFARVVFVDSSGAWPGVIR